MDKESKHFFEFDDLRLEPAQGLLYRGDELVSLTPKATQILVVLVERSGNVLTKEELMKSVWPDTFVEESNLTFHIHALRKALRPAEGAEKDRFIETVPRRGYRFIAPVRKVVPEPIRAVIAGVEVQSGPPIPVRQVRPAMGWVLLLAVAALAAVGLRLTRRQDLTPEPALLRLTNNVASDTQPDISPDGRHVVFVSNRDGGNSQIYVMDADGANPRNLTNNLSYNEDTPSWSPDGRRIVFQSKRRGGPSEIYIMNADGSNPTVLVAGARGAWSPDGRSIAYEASVDRHREVFVIPAGGGEPRRLTFDHDFAGSPVWSPDGARILFTAVANRHLQVETMRPDGSDRVVLTGDASNNRLAVWSPDAKQVLFNSDRDGTDSLFLMEADGSLQRRITDGKFMDDEASWSRDGRYIFFESERDGNREIYRMRVPTSPDGAVRLTNNVASDNNPTWSPDGKWIAFDSNRDGPPNIFVMDANGGQVRNLTRSPAADRMPAWSPDGKRIAFVSNRDGAPALLRMAVDGRRLQRNPADGRRPQGSPEGKKICFGHDAGIWVADLSGQPPRRVTRGEGCSWSGDGKSLLFDRDDHTLREIFRIALTGGEPVPITRDGKTNGGPAMSPDGTRIAFNSNRDGTGFGIYLMNADGSNLKRLTGRRIFDGSPAWSPDGRWIAFVSQRDGNQEIYKVAVTSSP